MGIQPFLLAASLRGIIAQRLVKRICTNCKTEYQASQYEKDILELDRDVKLYKGKGCTKCYNTGYSGRIAIHEILKMDKDVRGAITSGKNIDEITMIAEKNGMKTLKDNCKDLVLSGVTTIEEYSQVVYRVD